MHLRHLSLHDFRSYERVELDLTPGITVLLGRNGQGKTNLVEAAGYLATLGSHRVATDAPLVRFGMPQAVVRGLVRRDEREMLVEVEINPGRSNRARLNRSPVTRPRDVLGALRVVLFAPEDLSLVRGDPGERRRFMDELLVARRPRWAGVRADYDRVVKQRNALLKSAVPLLRKNGRTYRPRPGDPDVAEARETALRTLDVWDDQLVTLGAELYAGRLALLADIADDLGDRYAEVSDSTTRARTSYRSSLGEEVDTEVERVVAAGAVPDVAQCAEWLRAGLARVREQELDRGVGLVGPHRDDVLLSLGDMPAKGYASHGESWSLALALRLAAFGLLRRELGTDPVLVLDDVFAELDAGRRERLAALVSDAEQVLVTAAVEADVPEQISGGQRLLVADGAVTSALEPCG